jgi:uncharacterized protein
MTGHSRRVSALFAAFFAVLAFAFAPAAPAQTDSPALWKIAGPKGSVYLFGSIHLLPPDVKWRTPRVERALKESKVIVFEIDPAVAQDQQQMMQLIMKYGVLKQGEQLSALLPPKVNAELERTAISLGLPPANLAPMRPWLAALTLSVQFIVSQGYDLQAGIDNRLAEWARQNGRAIGSLETADAQLSIFADLTREQEIEFLAVSMRQIRETPQLLGEMLAAYRTGDIAGMQKTLNAAMDEVPSVRKRILHDRHERWLPQIQKMLAEGRSTFVCVGAAHLVGPDSVVAMLRARGVKVEGP